ncbi:HIT family protein [Streptomyces sp. ISL-11]|uniref:HIT family protein n=1 Tax=Streptomyces sp. ISL-11 TaxID=2819174 RepID=UPI001BEB45C3|nr:HIT domain-containing protein [Streptomyces sp. ISL-11]MBT2382877.1 HIT domain-containing protein [Streptomyces sp. ISL-11]
MILAPGQRIRHQRGCDDVNCVFCAIAAGESAGHRVFADDAAVAFLDVRPLFPGHVLVVPRRHAETLTDLPAAEVGPFFTRVRWITGAVERGMGATGSFVAANNRVSQSVPHFHVHVVPRNHKDGLRGFFWPRGRYASDEEAAEVAARVRAALERG